VQSDSVESFKSAVSKRRLLITSLVSSNFSSPKHRIGDGVASVFGSSVVDRNP
jgi:hypothetical protein